MRTIIAGSRNITDYSILVKSVDFAMEMEGLAPSVVLSGNAKGVDTLGERWATENNVILEKYPAEWNKYGKGAGFKRNALMASKADALLALWDGESSGTRHMIDMAKALKLKVVVMKVNI